MRDAPPPVTGIPALLAQAFPVFGASDAGKALAILAANVLTNLSGGDL